jgi:hypothetical protein
VLGGVFISYRRDDSAGFPGRIYDRLTKSLRHAHFFLDVDNIPAGLDFGDVLSDHVGRCDALIAVIGRGWLSSADAENRRRLDDPLDTVRIEIEAALGRGIRVIPVLVDGAEMPRLEELPESLTSKVISTEHSPAVPKISRTASDSVRKRPLFKVRIAPRDTQRGRALGATKVRATQPVREKSPRRTRKAEVEVARGVGSRRAGTSPKSKPAGMLSTSRKK